MKFNRPTKTGRRFPDWLNELRNQSGVYIIRRRDDRKVLYIGESHSGRLATTIKRHFWTWDDAPERPHFTYDPEDVEIAVITTPPSAAREHQNRLIRKILPRDNTAAMPPEELDRRDITPDVVPF